MTRALAKGANAPLSTARCAVTFTFAANQTGIEVCAVLLARNGKVRGDNDLVFFNHPSQDGVTLDGRSVRADLSAVPDAIDRIAIAASIDPQAGNTYFDAGNTPTAIIDAEGTRLTFTPPPFTHRETAAVLIELYRRGEGWKVRAVGQGWDTGLAGLATDFGVTVDDDGSALPPAVPTNEAVPPPPAKPTPAPTSVSTPTASPTPAPAISLDKMRRSAPGLVNLYKAAHVALEKNGVAGRRAAVYLVLDHSASMSGFYRDGTVQHLAEQALGLSANLDDDGTVPLVFFSHGVDLLADIGLDNHVGRVDTLHRSLDWGGTRFAPAMQAVIDHYRASGSTDPAFVIFQTDGEPFDRKKTRELLRQAATLPIFWQFVGFGPARHLRFLRSLDTLDHRAVDNAGFFAAGQHPRTRSDAELYDLLMKEFPTWLLAAQSAGILR
ncbi:VWA domain-containing protein [Streptomyces sp. NPDC006530]|uniref:VWA domain-containing protein n=1 Tax=Streptomyces sp. NPDC006530 TaxID=3364750 RepID=UPI00369E4442